MAVVDSIVHFLKSASPGDTLLCKARPVKQGRQIQIWDAEVFIQTPDSGLVLVATVRSTALNAGGASSGPDGGELKKNWAKLGTKFNVEKMTKAELAARFDKHSDSWEFLVRESKYEPVFRWIARISQDYRQSSIANVLDLACGVGLVGRTLRANGFTGKFVCCDISTRMVHNALATGNYEQSESFVHDLDNPLPEALNGRFHLATCTGAVEMLKNPVSFLKNVRAALLPAGELWVTFQDSTRVDQESAHPTEHQGMKAYSQEQIKAFVEASGFQIVGSPVFEPAAYYLPAANSTGSLRPVPFSFWRLAKK